ncbi:TPA: hypothetical protein QHO13_004791 [Escherichia coli]|uniref:hypothetical protein n=4 Tax=Escherichia coli TaxID=562 RepID=UPI0004D3B151|nr:hypothetical protein [Escherichia coli]HCA6860196.1 hypothetical protein [Escherichia coli O21:H2]HDU9081852.1 hypothetical protein [Shigella boydii]EFC4093248.1 hypothetical protein [Escherichia coli]EFO3943379.1 hypothetical protein [Escherichia coli]EFR2472956.1 hypothetical protein [Escherichia coli]
MSEINYQEGHETAGQAKPVAWRYRYVKKDVTDFQGKPWAGDWKYVPTKEDCNDRPNYEIQALFIGPPVPVTSEGLVKAVRFYEQVKRENPPVETGVWKDAVDWVLKEACCAVILGKADNPLASSNQVGELTMWVKRLVSQLKKANPDCKLPEKAMDYLKRNELISAEDVLR